MEDCIFCRIARGEIPCHKICEDENFLTFLDANPFTKGHVLVIPKKHIRWVWDANDEEYVNYMLSVKNVAELLKKTFNTDCVQQLIIGMEVPHAHIHLFPRTKDDGFTEFPKKPLDPKPSEFEMHQIAKGIIKNIE
ncbi:MAG: HIT domain-containing protein [Candidatus Pacearchaeota archaeon]